MIEMKHIHFAYTDKPICRDVSWALPKRGVVCLWGASGCGKTTLLRLIAGLEKPQSGTITATSASVVFQENRLLPWQTTLQNVDLACNDTRHAADILTQVGLGDHLDSYPDALSGGQQRRIALARALATNSELLLLDEPFNGLDEATKHMILPLIRAFAATRPVVLVTHAANEAQALGAAIVRLNGLPLTGELATSLITGEKN